VTDQDYRLIYSPATLARVFPSTRADEFFEALLGDASEGAYDITIDYQQFDIENKQLLFDIRLQQRPGKCLACNLTYGLPEVFSRHPLLDFQGIVQQLVQLLGGNARCRDWKLGATQSRSRQLHVIPLMITLA
jgi:hypothetical protein